MMRLCTTLLLIASLAGCQKPVEAPLAALPSAVRVRTVEVLRQPMPHNLALTGSLSANQQADVAANASGRITRTYVERGALVASGAPLLQLDERSVHLSEQEARANLAAAEAQQLLATQQCQRNEALLRQGAISKDEWDRISSQCSMTSRSAEAAKARAETALKNVSDATVRAPFAGMIAERFVNIGEYVQPATKVVALLQLQPLRLQLTIAEADVQQVQSNQNVTFTVQAYGDSPFAGQVKYIGPAVRSASRDFVIEALVDNQAQRLRPGMFVNAQLQLADTPQLTLPKSALRSEGSAFHVFVVVEQRSQERLVQVGPSSAAWVTILDGVQAGERVIDAPAEDMRDGLPVTF